VVAKNELVRFETFTPTLNPENLSLQQYLSYAESLELRPEASDSGMRPKTSVLSIFPWFTKSHVNTISVGPKAFETSRPEPKAFQRVKAYAKYLILFCIYEIGKIFVKTMHHMHHHRP
jgi:hypothetical protein